MFFLFANIAIVIVPTFTNVYHLPDTKYAGETPENFDSAVPILCLLLITGLVLWGVYEALPGPYPFKLAQEAVQVNLLPCFLGGKNFKCQVKG